MRPNQGLGEPEPPRPEVPRSCLRLSEDAVLACPAPAEQQHERDGRGKGILPEIPLDIRGNGMQWLGRHQFSQPGKSKD